MNERRLRSEGENVQTNADLFTSVNSFVFSLVIIRDVFCSNAPGYVIELLLACLCVYVQAKLIMMMMMIDSGRRSPLQCLENSPRIERSTTA